MWSLYCTLESYIDTWSYRTDGHRNNALHETTRLLGGLDRCVADRRRGGTVGVMAIRQRAWSWSERARGLADNQRPRSIAWPADAGPSRTSSVFLHARQSRRTG